MINPLTLYSKIKQLQLDVLGPLYVDHNKQHEKTHEELLYITGKRIAEDKDFIEDVCKSKFIRLAFKLIHMLGGADGLTVEDFDRFTNYVNDGGLDAMLNMLKSPDMDKAFVEELNVLPRHVRDNAYDMLKKARYLHEDYVSEYLKARYGTVNNIPSILLQRLNETNNFMDGLVVLAKKEQQLDEILDEVESS